MTSINILYDDKFKIAFSNVPSLDSDKIDMKRFNNNIKSVVIPDVNVEMIRSEVLRETALHPGSRTNDTLSQVTLEFKTSENMENYLSILEWAEILKYHKSDPFPLQVPI